MGVRFSPPQQNVTKNETFEHTFNRSKFVDNATSKVKQIYCNTMLVTYCRLYDNDCSTKNHWKQELISLLSDLEDDSLKRNDSYDKRLKALREAFFGLKEIVNKRFFSNNIIYLNNKEKHIKIPNTQKLYAEILKHIEQLLEYVAEHDLGMIIWYVDTMM